MGCDTPMMVRTSVVGRGYACLVPGETLSDPIAETVAALGDTPAGPELAAALASLDLTTLTGSQCVDVLKARYRQSNHERAQLLTVVAEVIRRTEADRRRPRSVRSSSESTRSEPRWC